LGIILLAKRLDEETNKKQPPKPKQRGLRRLVLFLLPVFLVLGWLAVDMYFFVTSPASPKPDEVVIEIPPGTSLAALSHMLQEKGLVSSAGKFRWLVRFRGDAREIKAGEYQLSTGLRPAGVLDKIVRGEVRLHHITFPEGYTMRQIADLLDERNLASYKQFMASATDPILVQAFNIPALTLEGYLFPDTYLFAMDLPVDTILRSFVTRFDQHFGPEAEEKAHKLGFTRHQVVILASVVEKETAVPEERPLIAGVFLNRLKKGIRLQSDPTVIYGLNNFDGNLTKAHLQMDTPYNTYTLSKLCSIQPPLLICTSSPRRMAPTTSPPVWPSITQLSCATKKDADNFCCPPTFTI